MRPMIRRGGKRPANRVRGGTVPPELAVEFRILGSLEARDGGDALPLGGVRERSLLALLLLNAGELVATDRLVDELWGERPPKTAVKTVQVYISRLRKLLGTATIVTSAPGCREPVSVL
jgi:DNA-binding SARP family transcriptional activator